MSVNDYLLKVDNPLVVPVNKKVRLITTANDVIHAWAVQSLGVRQDAILVLFVILGFGLKKKVTITANVPSYAAKSMLTCLYM